MKTLKLMLWGLFLDGLWVATLYFGFVQGVEGAKNIGLFFTWFMIVAATFSITQEQIAKYRCNPTPVWLYRFGMLISGVVMLGLLWYGAFFTALGVGWKMACLGGRRNVALKPPKEAT
jgi:hypothetical protein